MPACAIEPRSFEPPEPAKARVLAIDGGGIRGLIPALLLARLEELLAERPGSPSLAHSFDLLAGTSTGGLIALALTAPGANGEPAMTARQVAELYAGEEARAIFNRSAIRELPVVGGAIDLFRPRYSLEPLRKVLEARLGGATLGEAIAPVLVTAYDMRRPGPRIFKPWRRSDRSIPVVDAALATAAAPTYFPPHGIGDAALVDGGLYASNPAIAAIIEALKRVEDPVGLRGDDLLVVSLGTGSYEIGHDQDEVEGWGALDWILPSPDPPLVAAMLDAQSDAADHWAHVLLNHRPGEELPRAAELGAGPRYFRYQPQLAERLPLDDASAENVAKLRDCGERLVAAREPELEALAEALAAPAP